MSATTLLDTPKRISLQRQSKELRQALKEYEHAFAAEHSGHKPGKKDIRANVTIALKYSQYNKIREALDSNLLPTENDRCQSPSKRATEGQSAKPITTTPSRRERLHDIALGLPGATSSHPGFLTEIGPTPHRDGRILGLFDAATNSPNSDVVTAATPESSSRKRKLDSSTDITLTQHTPFKTPRTSTRRTTKDEDPLRHDRGSHSGGDKSGISKHARTPQSDTRKFALNWMLASPVTNRYFTSPQGGKHGTGMAKQTPLRDALLNLTPHRNSTSAGQETTPPYLKRSISFKERLLSATSEHGSTKTPASQSGPMKLKHFRSAATNVRHSAPNSTSIESHQGEHDDDLEAMREAEAEALEYEQFMTGIENANIPASTPDDKIPVRYKKKGQKRTTRKSIMRPGAMISATEPSFVAAGHDSDDDLSGDLEAVEETQPRESIDAVEDDIKTLGRGGSTAVRKAAQNEHSATSKSKTEAQSGKLAQHGKEKHKNATINPNAISHMNFRTLKIKNKNSKAKGKGRFGRGRR